MKIQTAMLAGALFAASSFSAFSAASPVVATVADFDGKVLVNSGQGFVPVGPSFGLKAGDKVLVGKNAHANIAFKSCTLSLAKPSVFVVTSDDPCNTPSVQPVADLPGGGVGGLPGGAGAGGLAGGVTTAEVATFAIVGSLGILCAVKCFEDPVSGN